MRRFLRIALVAVVALGASATSAAHGSAVPVTVASFPGVAAGFSESGGRVAWIDSAWILRVRPLHGGSVHSIRFTSFYQEIPDSIVGPRLRLLGRRLVWLSARGSNAGIDVDGRLVSWVETHRIAPGDPSRETFVSRIRTVTLP